MRLSYAGSQATVEAALQRMAAFIEG
jgi:hypothetical protein